MTCGAYSALAFTIQGYLQEGDEVGVAWIVAKMYPFGN